MRAARASACQRAVALEAFGMDNPVAPRMRLALFKV